VGLPISFVFCSAAWHGRQDAIWIADVGLTATCVDMDGDRLGEMEGAYPAGWEFVNEDVFEYATRTDGRWDVVTVDCPSNLFGRCAELLPLWCLLARRAVVLGCGTSTPLEVPDGWALTSRWYRSDFLGGVRWAVIERC
jgi:hypothetical protein